MSERTRRPLTHEDLFRFRLVSDPQLSPDGSEVAFVVQRTDLEQNRYLTSLWLARVDGAESRPFTGGEHSDRSPRWSPDGRSLAFLSDRETGKGKSQIWRILRDGGEAETLTQLEEGGIQEFHWSPDGTRIAFTYRPKPQWARKSAHEEREKQHRSTPPLVVRHLHYRSEGEGYFGDERWHVFMLDVASGAVTQLTQGDTDQGSLAWSPDGSRLAFITNRTPDPDVTPQFQEIRTVLSEGGSETPISGPPGPKGPLSWSPDGSHFAYYGHTDVRDVWSSSDSHLWLLPASGGEGRDLFAELDRTAGDSTLGDLQSFGGGWTGPVWSPDSSTIHCLVSDRGCSHVYSFGRDGSIANRTPGLRGEVGSLSLDAAGRRGAAVMGDALHPGEVYVAETAGETLQFRRVSELNSSLLAEVELCEPEEVLAACDSGEVHGWLITPGGETKKKLPLILYIHGGPHTQYGWAFMHEIQCLAARGFAVVFTNPRGSRGYGQAHLDAIRGDWGGPDYRDVMAAVEAVASRPDIHADRVGVTGGSYGGYMTNWIVGHTDRFRCAITQRSVVNLHSMAGTCDFNFGDSDYFGGTAWEHPEQLLAQSPLLYASNVNTPLLILHSEGDLRCPIEQAEQLFAALKRLGKVVEFVRYPREANHGLSRGGPPDLRLDRLQRISAWMERWLV